MYLTHTLYTDVGYASLKTLTSGFLSHNGFCSGEDPEDNLSRYPPRFKKPYIIVYLNRSEYSLVGSGILFKLVHLRKALQRKEIGVESAPREIRKHLGLFPNIVEIESHRLWPATGFFMARNLAVWFADKHRRAVMLTSDSEVLNIKRNPLLRTEQRIEQLEKYSQGYDSLKGQSQAKRLAKARFGRHWEHLTPASKDSLVMGLHMYQQWDGGPSPLCLDASPVVISLCKALESEINCKVLFPSEISL